MFVFTQQSNGAPICTSYVVALVDEEECLDDSLESLDTNTLGYIHMLSPEVGEGRTRTPVPAPLPTEPITTKHEPDDLASPTIASATETINMETPTVTISEHGTIVITSAEPNSLNGPATSLGNHHPQHISHGDSTTTGS